MVDKAGKVALISEPGAVQDVALDSGKRAIDINLDGTFNGGRVAFPTMVASGVDFTLDGGGNFRS